MGPRVSRLEEKAARLTGTPEWVGPGWACRLHARVGLPEFSADATCRVRWAAPMPT